MKQNELSNVYFDWMYRLVTTHDRYHRRVSFRKLLQHLHRIDFRFTLPMDGNRAEDGISLRYRFGDVYGYDQRLISKYLDGRPCSVFEMMVALAVRCEEQIMEDPEYGDRTGVWFWEMVEALGLDYMTDEKYDSHYVNRIIRSFLDRDYDRCGYGGLFIVKHSEKDMRDVEIWDQMCMHLDEML